MAWAGTALSAEGWLRWNAKRGYPSITFNSTGLHVTLPEGLLAEATAWANPESKPWHCFSPLRARRVH